MKPHNRKISPIPTLKHTGIRLSKPASYAAGAQGVKVALEHAISEMGAVRAFKTLAQMNKKDGFDCPGCAWPDPDDKRSVLGEYCENGAKALAEEATLKRVTPEFFEKHSIQEIASWSDMEIGKSGRLTHPMILREGSDHYEKISWEDAFSHIGNELKGMESPHEAVFYTSGRSSNEAAFLYGLFARALGTNNMPDCSNMCHESSGTALSQTLGIGKGSVVLSDFEKAEVVVIMGQNPGTNHPRMLSALQKCKKNGGKIITINPLEEAGLKRFVNPQHPSDYFTGGTALTDVYLQVKINQDVALLKLIMKELLEMDRNKREVFDHDFILNKTEGYQAFVEELEKCKKHVLLKACGVSEADIKAAVELIAHKKKIIICWAMGLTQHKNAVDNIKECVNLLLLKGSIGKEGAGTCPVRGHSNVQGDRTVGIIHKNVPRITENIKKEFGFDSPTEGGYDTVEAIQAMYAGKVKVFVSLGGNFASAASDSFYTAEAIQNCKLTVSISTKLNRTHTIAGATSIILPTLGRSEKDEKDGKLRKVSVENSMGKVHSSAGKLSPASDQLMSEPDIIAGIASATLGDARVPWQNMVEDYDRIRDSISKVIHGFTDYNKYINSAKEFYLPNNARVADFSKLPGGKAQFSVCALPEHNLEDDEFLLMTVRSHDQFNTTIYGLHDRYRGIHNERRVVMMHPEDMKMLGLEKLERIDIVSNYKGVRRVAKQFHVVPYSIPRGNLGSYFPETNVLVPIDLYADKSQTPVSKSIRVKCEKSIVAIS